MSAPIYVLSHRSTTLSGPQRVKKNRYNNQSFAWRGQQGSGLSDSLKKPLGGLRQMKTSMGKKATNFKKKQQAKRRDSMRKARDNNMAKAAFNRIKGMHGAPKSLADYKKLHWSKMSEVNKEKSYTKNVEWAKQQKKRGQKGRGFTVWNRKKRGQIGGGGESACQRVARRYREQGKKPDSFDKFLCPTTWK